MFEEKLETNVESASESEEVKKCLDEVHNHLVELRSDEYGIELNSELDSLIDKAIESNAFITVHFEPVRRKKIESFDLSRIENIADQLKETLSFVEEALRLSDKNDDMGLKDKVQNELLQAKDNIESTSFKMESAKEKLESEDKS